MLTVLALCNRTQNMVRPWLEAGFRAVTVDLQAADVEHPNRTHHTNSIYDVDEAWVRALNPVMMFAFPPCTDLAVSGARHFQRKGMQALIDALQIVERCRVLCEASGAPYMIENPVSTLSTYWRKPDYTFDPSDYAGYSPEPETEAYLKKTCLWTGNGFIMPQKGPHKPVLGSKMWRLPPSADRANLRAVTPLGFSYAVHQANAPFVRAA